MKKILLSLCLLVIIKGAGANPFTDSSYTEKIVFLLTQTGKITGTLTIPKGIDKMPLALIIAGSGPTDHDGNNPAMKNDGLKKLAYALADQHIASLRFDKRGIGQSQAAGKKEATLRFDDYVQDAREWIKVLKEDKRFSKLVVIGHSEGSLIGMLAAVPDAHQFISVAGAGQGADKLLKEQLATQPKQIQDMAFPVIDSLKNGDTVAKVNPILFSLFRPSVQPYLISWFKYDPAVEIKKLAIPVLIIQGTHDIQVSVEDAKKLAAAQPKAQLVLIENMNHIFRIVPQDDRQVNITTYSNASLPIADELVKNIVDFINKN